MHERGRASTVEIDRALDAELEHHVRELEHREPAVDARAPAVAGDGDEPLAGEAERGTRDAGLP